MEDYYKILGINETATDAEIKKSYRKLSLQHHPDKGGDQGKFQEINKAYQILGDKDKRAKYNMQKNNPFMSEGTGDINDIFKMFFGGGMPGMPGMSGMPGMPGMFDMPEMSSAHPNINIFRNGQRVNINSLRKPPPIIKKLVISLEQAYKDSTIAIDLDRWTINNHIKKTEKERLYIPIKKGIDDGEILILRNKGNINQHFAGDVKIFIKISNETKFIREGLNLKYEKNISLKESLTGFDFDIKHINGKTYTINNSKGNIIHPNFIKKIDGLGMKRGNTVGNLFIKFTINFPKTLTDEQIVSLNNIL